MSTAEHITNVTDANFETEVLNADTHVIVDLWAEWCGPCKSFGPTFEEVAGEYVGTVKFVKIDVDANKETPTKYGVRGIPTILFFKKGDADPITKVGALSSSQLKAFIVENCQ
tara:strand:- start:85193 stop:85531 length:339 start_codon:yes stop_codon:yes gene_type:complete